MRRLLSWRVGVGRLRLFAVCLLLLGLSLPEYAAIGGVCCRTGAGGAGCCPGSGQAAPKTSTTPSQMTGMAMSPMDTPSAGRGESLPTLRPECVSAPAASQAVIFDLSEGSSRLPGLLESNGSLASTFSGRTGVFGRQWPRGLVLGGSAPSVRSFDPLAVSLRV
jgi:hypothetical protein